MTGISFDYRLVPAYVMQAFLAPTEADPDTYMAEDQATVVIRGLLAEGFRWVRTEDGMAVLERQIQPKVVGTATLGTTRPKAKVNETELRRRAKSIVYDAHNCTSVEEEVTSLVRRLMELGH